MLLCGTPPKVKTGWLRMGGGGSKKQVTHWITTQEN